jgi:fucose 4-O-acetylase-like acetyltransferase
MCGTLNSSTTQTVDATKTERNDLVELFRVLAACGIIWFHLETAPGRCVGLAGLIFFLTVGVIFQQHSAQRYSGAEFFRKRSARLLIPWVAWYLIYGLLNGMTGKSLFPFSSGWVADVLTGPWIGLWYLPFSFLSACIVYGGVRLWGRMRPRVQFVGTLILSILALVLVSQVRVSIPLVAPWAQFLQATPSIPIGFAFSAALSHRSASHAWLVILQGGLLLACGMVYGTDPGLAVSYGLGTSLVAVGFGVRLQLKWSVQTVSSLCLGVYLAHGVVMSGFKIIPGVAQHYLLWFVLTVILSFIGVALIRRVPHLARIV